MGGECHLRQGTLVAGGGLWDLRSGRRLIQPRLKPSEVVIQVYRLRSSRRWVGLVHDSSRTPKTHVGLFGGGGRHRELGPVHADIPLGLSVRPQDDLAVCVEYDYGTSQIRVHTVPIAGRKERILPLPTKVCQEETRVTADEKCRGAPDTGKPWEHKSEAPAVDGSVPMIEAPPLPPPTAPPSRP